jgi:lysozyme family protein
MTIRQIIDGVIEREKGFVDHPADRGGPTCWGITQNVARRFGYDGAMRELPRGLAARIYFEWYVQQPGFDRVAPLSERIAEELVDTGVNMGPQRAGEFLQRVLNVLNRQARLWADLKLDGKLGPATLAALGQALARPGYSKQDNERVILTGLNALQGAAYISIAERDATQEEFAFGWLRTRLVVNADAGADFFAHGNTSTSQ